MTDRDITITVTDEDGSELNSHVVTVPCPDSTDSGYGIGGYGVGAYGA